MERIEGEEQIDFKLKIGLEIHLALNTEHKAFSMTRLEDVSYTSLGLLGTLPQINAEAIRSTYKIAHILDSEISKEITFERKSYFYFDLPRGYQLTQRANPIGKRGHIFLPRLKRKINIRSISLEEDTAAHSVGSGGNYQLSLQRLGVPLIEIVTEPEIRDAEEAIECVKIIRFICFLLKLSKAELESGQLRVDLNVSLVDENGESKTGRAEIKNLASYKAIEQATKSIKKHFLEKMSQEGTNIFDNETFSWVEREARLVLSRDKMTESEYLFIPESCIPTIKLSLEEREKLILKVEKRNPNEILRGIQESKLADRERQEIVSSYEVFWDCYRVQKILKDWANSFFVLKIFHSSGGNEKTFKNLLDFLSKLSERLFKESGIKEFKFNNWKIRECCKKLTASVVDVDQIVDFYLSLPTIGRDEIIQLCEKTIDSKKEDLIKMVEREDKLSSYLLGVIKSEFKEKVEMPEAKLIVDMKMKTFIARITKVEEEEKEEEKVEEPKESFLSKLKQKRLEKRKALEEKLKALEAEEKDSKGEEAESKENEAVQRETSSEVKEDSREKGEVANSELDNSSQSEEVSENSDKELSEQISKEELDIS
ncbi:glutamyl-tRNA amidotransferase [Mycoplasma ovis]|uniref:glutamyl-tRNA amidotransferase n=1 Tax=Mycoplasma ovis TaxID=171632 RepID=UPI00041AA6D6|nr:glutamyl-tRNA amidotransferase [Mycoplasma ovis]